MSAKCAKHFTVSIFMITLVLTLISTVTPIPNQQVGPIYDEQSERENEGLFQESLSQIAHLPLSSFDENAGPPLSEPQDITVDNRLTDSELSWELKLSSDSQALGFKNSPVIKSINRKPKREDSFSKNCRTDLEQPPSKVKNLIGTTLKRSDVAITHEALKEKLKKEDENRQKLKRNQILTPQHWSCETTYYWMDLGTDHYPRFVLNASCDSQTRCANGIYQCHPQKYKLKVLKRFVVSDTTAYDEQNNSLPEELRNSWRLKTVEIVHCCSCSSHPPVYTIRSSS